MAKGMSAAPPAMSCHAVVSRGFLPVGCPQRLARTHAEAHADGGTKTGDHANDSEPGTGSERDGGNTEERKYGGDNVSASGLNS